MVYAGLYPRGNEFKDLKIGIEKLGLNDAAFQYEPEQSEALGMGFRGGFLGIFHLQIIRERLQEEFGLDVLTTMPNSTYRVTVKNEDEPIYVENPIQFPDYGQIVKVEEPYMLAKMTLPNEMLNDIMRLAEGRRGELVDLATIGSMLMVTYRMPISEIAYDFFNELKSASHGFATLSTEFDSYQESDLVRIDIAVDYAKVDALTFVMHRSKVDRVGTEIVSKLKDLIPRKLQSMPVQAIVEGRAIARADVPPLRKAAASGTKFSKKQQQLRRQGQKKSDIELPQSVFDAILDMNSNWSNNPDHDFKICCGWGFILYILVKNDLIYILYFFTLSLFTSRLDWRKKLGSIFMGPETKFGRQSFFDGGLLSLIGWSILGFIITGISFGILYPWALVMVYGWKINHTVIDGHRMQFNGSAVGLFGNWIKWLVLIIITLGIYGFWVGIKLEDWKAKNTRFVN